MDAIDGNIRVQQDPNATPPSLLFLIIDTSPIAWSQLSSQLPLATAIASLLVFINAHLAFSQENRVAVLAAHCGRTHWLYPSPSKDGASLPPPSSDKYRPFAIVESSILSRLNALLASTSPASLNTDTASTPLAGALTLGLTYINRARVSLTPVSSHPHNSSSTDPSHDVQTRQASALASRILLVSTSAADLASQYIPLTNAMFAAQHAGIPIDVLKLAGDTALLQQAAYTTNGIFISPDGLSSSPSITMPASLKEQKGKGKGKDKGKATISSTSHPIKKDQPITLLPYLLQALLPDITARPHLYPATSPHVDFRAACFCHRRVVSTGYVCSICLSIFCGAEEVLGPGLECLTCGTRLVLGGARAVAGSAGDGGAEGKGKEKKKKKKRREGGEGGAAAAAAAGSAA